MLLDRVGFHLRRQQGAFPRRAPAFGRVCPTDADPGIRRTGSAADRRPATST